MHYNAEGGGGVFTSRASSAIISPYRLTHTFPIEI